MNDKRLDDLESKYSFQDVAVEELRQTMHEQYLAIEKLIKNVKRLTEQLENMQNGVSDPSHKKPPHY